MGNIVKPIEHDYHTLRKEIYALAGRYPFLHLARIGKSVMGRELLALQLGKAKSYLLIAAAFHGTERITAAVALRFAEQVCAAVAAGGDLTGIPIRRALKERGLIILPMVNPDGCDIAIHGEKGCLGRAERIKRLCGGHFEEWNANGRGVDINHNFDAGWLALKEKEKKAGIYGPSKKQYGGSRPVSEPETAALVSLCENIRFEHAIAFHSQGEVIYWSWGEKENKKGLKMAEIFAASSGYALDVPLGLALGGGFKDWFIERFNRPAFTVEIGKGENPLPFLQVNEIYEKIREMLVLGILM